MKLVQALAFQIGNEVSYNELSQLVGIDNNTVDSYINLLEKAYIVFRQGSFSRNLRNEIKSNRKIYFYDTSIRNAIIGNFTPLNLRQDIGSLWENFLIAERIKQNNYKERYAKSYFWRTKYQQEIDYIEETVGQIYGYEFKWNPTRKVKFPKSFTETYNAKTTIITKDNYRDFIIINQ